MAPNTAGCGVTSYHSCILTSKISFLPQAERASHKEVHKKMAAPHKPITSTFPDRHRPTLQESPAADVEVLHT